MCNISIPELKKQLSITEVLSHYGLSANRNKMLNCPFHDDKTPSMQVYPKTDTVYCFSSNCELHGRSIDQIDFIMYKDKLSKHEAISKAKQLAGIIEPPKESPIETAKEKENLESIFNEFRKNLQRSSKAKKYLEKRNLNNILEIGYNYREFKELKECIIFPLKDKNNQIVSFYGRSISNTNGRHYYSSNRRGLYPNYPSKETKKLVLTESIIDALSIKVNTDYEVLSMYGTNGLTQEHKQAILNLENLSELIFFLDGDEAGKKSIEKYSKELKALLPNIKITKVTTPEGEDPNSLLEGHDSGILTNLIENRLPVDKGNTLKDTENLSLSPKLDTSKKEYFDYIDDILEIKIYGGIQIYPVDKLRVTVNISKRGSLNPTDKFRHKVDLYNDDQLERLIVKTKEKLELGIKSIRLTLTNLVDELEAYRESQIQKENPKEPPQKNINRST